MSIQVFKCPICNNMSMAEIPTNQGNSYVITEVNTVTKNFLATTGLPVKLMGCTSCKTILLRNDSLAFQQ